MFRPRAFLFLTLAGALALATGCSSFHRQWHRPESLSGSRNPLEGRWEGRWESDENSHAGQLRCIVTHQTNQFYTARFHATYKRLFNLAFGYTTVLEVATTNGGVRFRGSADLGWYAGGVYHYEGTASPTNFYSTYSCKHDHGKFFMTRPEPSAAKAPSDPSPHNP